jgi:hypothetical protein
MSLNTVWSPPFLPRDTVLPAVRTGDWVEILEKASPVQALPKELRRVSVTPASSSTVSNRMCGDHRAVSSTLKSQSSVPTKLFSTPSQSKRVDRSSPSMTEATFSTNSQLQQSHFLTTPAIAGHTRANKVSPSASYSQRFPYTPPAPSERPNILRLSANMFGDDDNENGNEKESVQPHREAEEAEHLMFNDDRDHAAADLPDWAESRTMPGVVAATTQSHFVGDDFNTTGTLVFENKHFTFNRPLKNRRQTFPPQCSPQEVDGRRLDDDNNNIHDDDDGFGGGEQQPFASPSQTPLLTSLLQAAGQNANAAERVEWLLQTLLRQSQSTEQCASALRVESDHSVPPAMHVSTLISLQLRDLLNGPEMQSHLSFLRALDEQFQTRAEDPQRLLEKYLLLPVSRIQEEAFRQVRVYN